ncbi:MAG TPA: hypothetical protein VMM76_26115 [Pirellulaceae bacterium]|nr:hypothetical protein [Pirellulaceae bacterium]
MIHPNIERCLSHLSAFAELLGWHDLVPHHHDADGSDVVWYTCGTNEGVETDFFLQINESPSGKTNDFVGAVYALKHNLWTGWHRFPCPDTDATLRDAIARIDDWLNRKWFTDDQLRLRFSHQHPECMGFDWKRIRECRPLHEP